MSGLSEPFLVPDADQKRNFGLSRLALPITIFAIVSLVGVASNASWRQPTTTLAATDYWFGVSLGGWLLLEINPSKRTEKSGPDVRPQWMFDQIEAAAELDFVTDLRKVSDEYAIKTLKNHWDGYITDASLDAAVGLGINAVRIPVGYWITDAPVGGSSPMEYGFSPEGFVTGGLNHLQVMLRRLRARKIVALIDMHALPCNSACVSDGLSCADPFAFVAEARVASGGLAKCGGGVYPTSRVTDAGTTWADVGLSSVRNLAEWIAALPAEDAAVVVALQLGNEPALNSPGFNAAVRAHYEAAIPVAREALPTTPLIMSFIPPNDYDVPGFVKQLEARADSDGAGPLIIDHHWYLNWASAPGTTLPWDDLHRRACHEASNSWSTYTAASVPIILGEWSLATNYDAPLALDGDAAVRAELRQLYLEQLHMFTGPGVVGSFFWTLRMGSGWDPRPTATHPSGRQLPGSAANRSLPGYKFRVWSFLELAALGIATPLGDTAAAKAACTGI